MAKPRLCSPFGQAVTLDLGVKYLRNLCFALDQPNYMKLRPKHRSVSESEGGLAHGATAAAGGGGRAGSLTGSSHGK